MSAWVPVFWLTRRTGASITERSGPTALAGHPLLPVNGAVGRFLSTRGDGRREGKRGRICCVDRADSASRGVRESDDRIDRRAGGVSRAEQPGRNGRPACLVAGHFEQFSLSVSNSLSGGDWELDEVPAVRDQRPWRRSAAGTVESPRFNGLRRGVS